MDSSISVVFFLLLTAVFRAASTPTDYWNAMLPNTPMPGAILDRLRPNVGVGVEALANAHLDERQFYVYGEIGTQVQSLPDESIFFLEKDLRPGTKMRLDFTRSAPAVAFLPRGEATTIPFSSENLSTILSRFSVQPNSAPAVAMTKTLQQCEQKAAAEASKYCATSLESMVDFATSALGTRVVRAVSSVADMDGEVLKQEYVVASSPTEKMAASSIVTCHAVTYPYAVFYCHTIPATRAYGVPVVGKDGAKVDAVAVCHMDTSAWKPEHPAFQMLKVKPGTVPVCHFLPPGAVVWAPLRAK